jgi:redox-sensitive bicupin YhaK (pirin superfamily)
MARPGAERDRTRYEAGKLLGLDARASQLRPAKHSTAMMLDGEPVGEHFIYWDFISVGGSLRPPPPRSGQPGA